MLTNNLAPARRASIDAGKQGDGTRQMQVIEDIVGILYQPSSVFIKCHTLIPGKRLGEDELRQDPATVQASQINSLPGGSSITSSRLIMEQIGCRSKAMEVEGGKHGGNGEAWWRMRRIPGAA